MERENRTYRYYYRHQPSFFWPITLITVGITWLLVNNGTIPAENVYRLFPLWPVLLILAGISLLLRRVWWPLSGLVWAAAAAFFVWALINPPAFLPEATMPEVRHETYNEALGSTQSASVTMDLSGWPNRVYALENSSDLFLADVNYIGGFHVGVSGSDQKKDVRFDENRDTRYWTVGFVRALEDQNRPWEIGLSPRIPLRLNIDTNSGPSTLNLEGLRLESLRLEGGSGNIEINLPEESPRFLFDYRGGSGALTVNVPDGSDFELRMDTGSGNVVIDLPDGAAVRVDVRNGGSGALKFAAGFTKVEDRGDDDEGIWENEAYTDAGSGIDIVVSDQGSGDIEIR